MITSQTKKQIRGLFGDQISEDKAFCPNCDKESKFLINFKKDKITCTGCKSEMTIPDYVYEDLQEQFKKAGLSFK
jgi:ribosomal protein S27AE